MRFWEKIKKPSERYQKGCRSVVCWLEEISNTKGGKGDNKEPSQHMPQIIFN